MYQVYPGQPAQQKRYSYQILAVVALLTNFSFWSTVLSTYQWKIGACLFSMGIIYLALPNDLIEDKSKYGMVDDFLAAVCAGAGLWTMTQAQQEEPLPAWAMQVVMGIATYDKVNIYNAVFVFTVLVLLWNKDLRYTLIALAACAGIPCLCFGNCAPLWALGFTCLAWGMLNPMFPLRSAAFDSYFGPTAFLVLGVGFIILAGFAGIPLLDTSFDWQKTVEAVIVSARR
jgi:hypothetical protein